MRGGHISVRPVSHAAAPSAAAAPARRKSARSVHRPERACG